jgi:hypothetical protein
MEVGRVVQLDGKSAAVFSPCHSVEGKSEKAETIKIEDLQRVQLKPGDVLAVRLHRPVPCSDQGRIIAQLKRVFPDNEVIILERGLELCVIAP